MFFLIIKDKFQQIDVMYCDKIKKEKSMKSLHDNFDRFYNETKKEDKDIVKNILKEIKKYDIYDIITKLSALNLVPENQNKAIIIEPIIAAILTLSRKN